MAPVSILGATKESNKSEEGDTNKNTYSDMCLIYPLCLKDSHPYICSLKVTGKAGKVAEGELGVRNLQGLQLDRRNANESIDFNSAGAL